MTNINNDMTTDVQIAGRILDKDGSKAEVLVRIAQATAALLGNSLERQQYYSKIKDPSDTFSRDMDLPVCMRNLDTHRRS